MNEQHENRRVRMTKRMMKDALLELLEKQELSRISVTAICEAADVHRSTFYKYYTAPADLLREMEQDFIAQIPLPPASMDASSKTRFLSSNSAFFDFIKENEKAFRILLSRMEDGSFILRLVELICDRNLVGVEDSDALRTRFLRLYIANGAIGMLWEWINQEFPISSQEFAKLIYVFSRRVISQE